MVLQKSTLMLVDGSELEFHYNHCANLPLMLTLKDEDKSNIHQGLHLQDTRNLGKQGHAQNFCLADTQEQSEFDQAAKGIPIGSQAMGTHGQAVAAISLQGLK